MNIEEVRVYGLGLPQATERCPFGPDTLSLEIGGRMFCLMTLDGEWDFFNLKVDPDYSLQLQERHRSIRPGYHQNKKHWISVDYYGDVPDTLQRDLTDSTVLRNIGVPMAHSLIAFASTMKGLDKLLINREAIRADLEPRWNVLAEAIQTVLRREGYEKPYETLKELTRVNTEVTQRSIADFINSLNIDPTVKAQLLALTPLNYTGF